jgi:hypothetical protein
MADKKKKTAPKKAAPKTQEGAKVFRVLHPFWDMEDPEKTVYAIGDSWPRKGIKPTKKRIDELMGADNKIGCPLIAET